MDTITFLGPRIPLEVKKLFSVLPKCKQEQVIKLLYFVLEYIKIRGSDNTPDISTDQTPAEFDDATFSHFCEQIGLGGAVEKQVAVAVFIGLHVILKAAIRSRLKFDLLQKDLVQELRVPDFLSNEIIKILKAR